VYLVLSLSLNFYYLLLNSCDGNDAKQRVFFNRLFVALKRAGTSGKSGFILAYIQSFFTFTHARNHFLSRVSILTRDMSVRPSVCLSVRPWRSGTIWKRLYQHQTSSRNSDGVTPCGGAKYRWDIKILRFSTNKSLCLASDARYRHSYYGRRIGTRMRSIKWCHFQWPWTNPNSVFKVTSLFDTKYLTCVRSWRAIFSIDQQPRQWHFVICLLPYVQWGAASGRWCRVISVPFCWVPYNCMSHEWDSVYITCSLTLSMHYDVSLYIISLEI